MSSDAKPYPLQPTLPPAAEPFVQQLRDGLAHCRTQGFCIEELLATVLTSLQQSHLTEADYLATRLFFEILQDLTRQGWGFAYRGEQFTAIPPGAVNGHGTDQQEIKRQIRASLVAARDDQLREPSIRRFILDMERPRWVRGQQVSVLSLFVAPHDFAADLQRRLHAPPALRDELLLDAVQPYLQMATDERDTHTNLRLINIWRYCRYTWSLPYSSIPGRQIFYLVRDASRPLHPVMGIGALGNSIVQITERDRIIGWSLDALRHDPTLPAQLPHLEAAIEYALGEVYWHDLVTEEDIRAPTDVRLAHLAEIAHRIPLASRTEDRSKATNRFDDTHSDLYRRKRALELHSLLRSKYTFQLARTLTQTDQHCCEWLLAHEDGLQALGVAIRSIKKRHVGVSMMDVTTCGAIPPYSEVLGGKLTAVLMGSPQVIADYRHRYKDTSSEIASRMKGEAVVRPAQLVLLGTTSLYYVGSSQYNRLRVPVANGELRYHNIGKTRGYGTVHLSQRTYRTLQQLLRSHADLKPESSTFAAGVNYKMRSVASALGHLGLSRLQKHETPRLVYLVPLATNWREYLTGRASEPHYIYSNVEQYAEETAQLVAYWKQRWFLPRVQRHETMTRLRAMQSSVRVSDIFNDAPSHVQTYMFAPVDTTDSSANGGNLMAEQGTIPWHTLAELKDQRISIAEQLTPDELEVIHIPTKLDQSLVSLVAEGRRVYLSGNPGDGKTHIIRRYSEQLTAYQAFMHLDASAEEEDRLVAGIDEAIRENRPAVVAINEGPLRRLLPRLPPTEQQELRAQLNRPYLYEAQDTQTYTAVLINLGARQVLEKSIIEGAFRVVLDRVDYREAPPAVKENHALLRRPRVQQQLLDLLQLVAYSGAHITMHELLGFFAYILTGGEKTPERASAIPRYSQLIFTKQSPLYRWLRDFDPIRITHPLVDMQLWESPHQMQWLEPLRETPPEQLASIQEAQNVFHELKRRYFFEASDGGKLLDMLPEDRKTFYQLLQDSTEAQDTAKIQVLEALAHFFGDPARGSHGKELRIWTSLKYTAVKPPTAFISSQSVSADAIRIHIPKLRAVVAQCIEYEPSHVRLVVPHRDSPNGESVGLDIDLELWLALMKLKRGTSQQHHDPVIGRRLNHFMSRLAAQFRDQQSGFVEMQVRDLSANRTYEIKISVEKGKYHL